MKTTKWAARWPPLLIFWFVLLHDLGAWAATTPSHARPVPVASRIHVGNPDATYQTTVTGEAGAVDPGADVAPVTLETGHYATTRAASDGSFSASIFAPRGTSILVKSDPRREFVHHITEAPTPRINSHLSMLTALGGTIVRLAKDSPNLDLHNADGYAGADTITISMFLSGTDVSGARKHFARQVVIQGEEIQMPEQNPAPKRQAVKK